jgi:hypothetical protein
VLGDRILGADNILLDIYRTIDQVILEAQLQIT